MLMSLKAICCGLVLLLMSTTICRGTLESGCEVSIEGHGCTLTTKSGGVAMTSGGHRIFVGGGVVIDGRPVAVVPDGSKEVRVVVTMARVHVYIDEREVELGEGTR